MIANAEILAALVAHLVLTGAPAVAAALLAGRYGARGTPVLVAVALAASGLVATGAFWAYFADPTIGKIWDYLVLLGAVEVVVWLWLSGRLERDVVRRLSTPLALWALGTAFVVFLGFLHGGTDDALGTSASRFSGPLPTDNDIPRFFAEWFAANGGDGRPPVYPPDWLMSDRPPLQVGYVLSQNALLPTAKPLDYEILSATIQALWIPALWALLCAARLRPATRALAMVAALVSDVAILHGFFVWPKLIAAAFLLAAFALIVSSDWSRLRADPRVAALVGCLLALAMLGHGSSVYGVIPLVAVAAVRGFPGWRWLGIAALAGAVLLGSWSAYQRFDDPPGNRLVKWHLGGVMTVDDRGTVEAIADSYREAGVGGTLENKWNNVEEITGLARGGTELGGALDELEAGDPGDAIVWLRGFRFFALFAVLGVFLVAPAAMLLGRRRGRRNEADWRFALSCLAVVGIGCFFWVLLQYGVPGHSSTMIHAGTLAIPLLAICGCVAGLRATYPRLATAVVALNALLVLVLYVPSLTPPAGTEYSPVAATIAALSLLGFGALLYSSSAMRGAPRAKTSTPTMQTPTKSAIEGSSSS